MGTTQYGPATENQLLAAGVKATTLVWAAGMSDWTKAGDIAELAPLFTTSTPPPIPTNLFTPPPPPMQPGQSISGNAPIAKPNNCMIWAILSTVLCCIPCGIVGIIYANQVDSKYKEGDYQGSIAAADKAKMWTIISAICGVLAVVLGFIMGVIEELA